MSDDAWFLLTNPCPLLGRRLDNSAADLGTLCSACCACGNGWGMEVQKDRPGVGESGFPKCAGPGRQTLNRWSSYWIRAQRFPVISWSQLWQAPQLVSAPPWLGRQVCMSWTRHVFRQDSLGPLAGIGFVFVLYGVLRWASSSSSPRALQWPTRAVPRSAFSGSCRSAKMNGREDQDQARKWQSNAVQHHHPIASSKQASGVYLFLVSSSVRLICFGFLFLLGSSRNFEGIVCLLWKLSWSYSVTNIWKAVVFPDPVLVCFDCKQL